MCSATAASCSSAAAPPTCSGAARVFLIALGVFVVASALGGIATDGTVLVITRFVKGLSAAFTAPAGLSIITTTFAEGPARNKALSVYTATGATGFSLGLVFGGLLTEFSWRLAFLIPAPVALVALLAGLQARAARRRPRGGQARLRPSGCGHPDRRDAAPRLHARRGAHGRVGLGAYARLTRGGRRDPRRVRLVGEALPGAARPARDLPLLDARPREPRGDGARRVDRLPVHRDALHAAAARLVGAPDRPRDLPGRRPRGRALASGRRAHRPLRSHEAHRGGPRVDRARVRPVPADRPRARATP